MSEEYSRSATRIMLTEIAYSPAVEVPDGTAVVRINGAWYRLLWNDATCMIAPEAPLLAAHMPEVGLLEWTPPNDDALSLCLDVAHGVDLPPDDDYE